MNTITLPVSRAASISASITSALMGSLNDTNRATDARKDATDMASAATAGREVLMGTLSQASIAEDWSVNEIEEAMNVVAKSINDDKSRKTMATLISEVKHAAYPEGRRVFASLVNARNIAWDAEDAEKKAAKEDKRKPDDLMSRAFSRRYQTLVAMLRAVNETDPAKRVAFDLTSEDGLLEWARSRDPQRSPKALADKVAGLRESLLAISTLVGGHDANLATIVQALGFVDERSLAAALAGPPEVLHVSENMEDAGENTGEDGEDNSGSDAEGNTQEVPNDLGTPFAVPRSVVITLPQPAQPAPKVSTAVDVGDLDALLVG